MTTARQPNRHTHGIRKQDQAATKNFAAPKKEIAAMNWPVVYVLPSCTCSAHSFPHYHHTMHWTEGEEKTK